VLAWALQPSTVRPNCQSEHADRLERRSRSTGDPDRHRAGSNRHSDASGGAQHHPADVQDLRRPAELFDQPAQDVAGDLQLAGHCHFGDVRVRHKHWQEVPVPVHERLRVRDGQGAELVRPRGACTCRR